MWYTIKLVNLIYTLNFNPPLTMRIDSKTQHQVPREIFNILLLFLFLLIMQMNQFYAIREIHFSHFQRKRE